MPPVFSGRESLSLAGSWRLNLDSHEGIASTTPVTVFEQCIQVPGTTDTQGLGTLNPARELRQLTRRRLHVGPAWYQCDVDIPSHWAGSRIELYIERTKPSRLWLDGLAVGDPQLSVYTPHCYDLGECTPGRHQILLCIDNAHPIPVSGHALAEATQTNWNGLLGCIELRSRPVHGIDSVRLSYDAASHSARLAFALNLPCTGVPRGVLRASILLDLVPPASPTTALSRELPLDQAGSVGEHVLSFPLPADFSPWDEYHPGLCTVELTLCGMAGSYSVNDALSLRTGLRDFRRQATRLLSAGRTVFLRGKHDCCAFPLTGHPPMEKAFWDDYFAVCRDYGLNHVRFHSWTPPEAAFAAADQAGMFLLPELPFWGQLPDPSQPGLEDYLESEGRRILDTYGNHPSFCLFSVGNETGGSREQLAALVARLRAYDPRPLFASGTNAFFNSPGEQAGDDFWVTMRTRPGLTGRTRASYSHADLPLGHIETEGPGTLHSFSRSMETITLPLIGHETGQYQFYPDYDEIAQYIGVTEARNLEHYASLLKRSGLWEQRKDFFRAAGAQALRCYREDIEAALRTPGWTGFQLLDLQDYPGQGTALIGILNAFMRSKGLISPLAWRSFCNDCVPLLRMEKHVWSVDEAFTCELQLAHYGRAELPAARIAWRLLGPSGAALLSGTTPFHRVPQGKVFSFGALSFSLLGLPLAAACELELSVQGTDISNRWPLWIFEPAPACLPVPSGLLVSRILDMDTIAALEAGARVVLFPRHPELANSLAPLFMTDFWCYPMFKRVCDQYGLPPSPGTMGLFNRVEHPALAAFPTAECSDWQWWHLVAAGRPLILNDAPSNLRPIVQVIDNFDRNHRLGLLFECRVGQGSLLVCSIDPERISSRPEGARFLYSLYEYAASPLFQPSCPVEAKALQRLLYTANPARDETPRERVILTAEEAAQGPGAAVLS